MIRPRFHVLTDFLTSMPPEKPSEIAFISLLSYRSLTKMAEIVNKVRPSEASLKRALHEENLQTLLNSSNGAKGQ